MRGLVQSGLDALRREHVRLVELQLRDQFKDSLDLDAALRGQYPKDPRWDYLVSHDPSSCVVGIETHTAKGSEISRVIAKCRHAREQLRTHLTEGQKVARWFWIASGSVSFLPGERATFRLKQAGIDFVGRLLREKHLPSPTNRGKERRPRRSRRRGVT